MSVLVQTSFGDITIDLQTQKFPNACYNFLKLCKLKHYNNSIFMKVQKDFVTEINTKRPTTVWQQLGQQKTYFKDEVDLEAKVNALGLVGTSNKGPNLNNSEFFITLTKSHLSSLNGKHTVFGKVQEGFDILKKINDTYVDQKGRPHMNIRILHTFVLDDPFEDPPQLKIPSSPRLQTDPLRLQAVEHLEMLEKYSNEKEILDATRKEKAKKQALTLEMIGALPDASVKPPQNILFVCKLNPITQQRDLEIIFARFGPIKSVQVVRDWKTGQSLQYAFIQFESERSCEQAYLKMNNVIIDDRRIKVDFSQSVSKLMPKMKSVQAKTYKATENKEKGKQIVSRFKKTKDYYGQKKYQIVGKDAPQNSNKEGREQKVKYKKRLSEEDSEKDRKSREKGRRRDSRKRQQSSSSQQKSNRRYKGRDRDRRERQQRYRRSDRKNYRKSRSQSSSSATSSQSSRSQSQSSDSRRKTRRDRYRA